MAILKDELTIKGLILKNRLVLHPLTTNYGTPDNLVFDDLLEFYSVRSKDIGLTIVEETAVSADGCIVPNSLGLWDDTQIEGMAKLVKIIKIKDLLP
jgi:NADPH2 dehydrogenase